jgi:CheY-like chemotaxis protein
MTSTPTTFLIADDSQLIYVLQRYADSYGARLMVDFQAPGSPWQHEQPAGVLGLTGLNRGRMALRALRADQRTCAIPIVLCTAHEIDQQDWAAETDQVLVQPVMYTEFAVCLIK